MPSFASTSLQKNVVAKEEMKKQMSAHSSRTPVLLVYTASLLVQVSSGIYICLVSQVLKHVCSDKLLDDSAKSVPIILCLLSGSSYPWAFSFCHQFIAVGKMFTDRTLAIAQGGHGLRCWWDLLAPIAGVRSHRHWNQDIKVLLIHSWTLLPQGRGIWSADAQLLSCHNFSPQISLAASFFSNHLSIVVVLPYRNFPTSSYFIIGGF